MVATRYSGILVLLALALVSSRAVPTLAQSDPATAPPALTGSVVDDAGILDVVTRAALIAKLAAFQTKTTDQVVVATVKSLQGRSIEDYSNWLFRERKLGRFANNGVLVLVASDEGRALIGAGLGLEDRLPQDVRELVLDNMRPGIEINDFSRAVTRGVEDLIQLLTVGTEEWKRLPSQRLAQKRAVAKELDEKFRALSKNQRDEVMKQLSRHEIDRDTATEQQTYLHAIQFLGETRGIAIDWHGRLHRTADGGVSWTEQDLPLGIAGWLHRRLERRFPGQGAAFKDMHFADERFGLIVGPSGVLQSEDGGTTWRALPSPSKFGLNATFCSVNRTCWVAGADKHEVFRLDSHSAWSHQRTPATESIVQLQFVGDSTGWAISRHGEIIGTIDGGERWNRLFYNREKTLWGLHFIDERLGWVVGADGLVMRTDDGGKTWAEQKLPVMPPFPIGQVRLHAVKFADAKHGWVAGLHGMIFATADGGKNWKLQRFEGLPANALTIYSLAITEGPTIWAAGNGGNIFVSRDGGAFWFPVHGTAVDVFGTLKRILDQAPSFGG